MIVKDLIAILESLDPDALVILSRDSEGNGFSPMDGDYTEGIYVPDCTWSGEFHEENYHDGSETDCEDDCDDDCEEHPVDCLQHPDAVKAIAIWPIA